MERIHNSFGFLFGLIFTIGLQAQTETLLDIISSAKSIEFRQEKIDSLLLINEKTLTRSDLAELYHNLGNKWYFVNWKEGNSTSDIKNAIAFTQCAVDGKQNSSNTDIVSLKKSLYNLGYFLSLNDNFFDAIEAYSLLIDLGQEDVKTQKANFELALLYEKIGDFHKSLECLNRIQLNYNKIEVDPSFLKEIHITIASLYSSMGYQEYSKIIKLHLKKADSISNDASYENNRQQLQINQLEGNLLLKVGHYQKSVPYFKKVLLDSLELDDFDKSVVHNSIGLAFLKLNNYNSALIHLAIAIEYSKNYSQPYENLGDLYIAQHRFEEGLVYYQKAIYLAIGIENKTIIKNLPELKDLTRSSEKIDLLDHLIAKANAWLKYYQFDKNKTHLEEALKTFSLADGLIDVIRNESTEYQSKLFWRQKGATLYMNAVEVCYLLKKTEQAFHFMERNKAILLLEDITNEQAKDIAKLPQAMAKQEFELKRAIHLSENELQTTEATDKDSVNILQARVYKSKREYELFMDSLAIKYPDYTRIKKKVDVLNYVKFKENYISNDEVVLHYIINKEQGYGLLSTNGKPYFFKLENIPNLNEKLVQLYSLLTDQNSDRGRREVFYNLAYQVFTKLVPQEVYQEIKGKKLTLINDYILQQIPFEALVTDVQNVKYLIEDTEIRYAYSISYLDAKRYNKSSAAKEFLGLAPVKFGSLGLANLNFSDEEVNEAEKIFNGDILLNDQATKNRFLSDQNSYKIIHLSTHADIGEGGNPWIAFSDDKLFLNEIYALKTQSEIVVLSGCNTSIGELKKGEGAMSLARGFFHSGSKSVVSSLWTLNDKKSKELITEFYKGLSQGMTKSASMQNAKIKFLAKYRNSLLPSYWASLIVIGDNAPLVKTGFSMEQWMLIGVGSILGALILYGTKKQLTRHKLLKKY